MQQAFCPLLWRANGGAFNADGTPRHSEQSEYPIRGLCTRAYDCDSCELMMEELTYHAPYTVWWCCPDCISDLKKKSAGRGLHLSLPGFYTEGTCWNPSCQREGRYSVLLQLVLGDIRKEGG